MYPLKMGTYQEELEDQLTDALKWGNKAREEIPLEKDRLGGGQSSFLKGLACSLLNTERSPTGTCPHSWSSQVKSVGRCKFGGLQALSSDVSTLRAKVEFGGE
jgi:hypothetical protein